MRSHRGSFEAKLAERVQIALNRKQIQEACRVRSSIVSKHKNSLYEILEDPGKQREYARGLFDLAQQWKLPRRVFEMDKALTLQHDADDKIPGALELVFSCESRSGSEESRSNRARDILRTLSGLSRSRREIRCDDKKLRSCFYLGIDDVREDKITNWHLWECPSLEKPEIVHDSPPTKGGFRIFREFLTNHGHFHHAVIIARKAELLAVCNKNQLAKLLSQAGVRVALLAVCLTEDWLPQILMHEGTNVCAALGLSVHIKEIGALDAVQRYFECLSIGLPFGKCLQEVRKILPHQYNVAPIGYCQDPKGIMMLPPWSHGCVPTGPNHKKDMEKQPSVLKTHDIVPLRCRVGSIGAAISVPQGVIRMIAKCREVRIFQIGGAEGTGRSSTLHLVAKEYDKRFLRSDGNAPLPVISQCDPSLDLCAAIRQRLHALYLDCASKAVRSYVPSSQLLIADDIDFYRDYEALSDYLGGGENRRALVATVGGHPIPSALQICPDPLSREEATKILRTCLAGNLLWVKRRLPGHRKVDLTSISAHCGSQDALLHLLGSHQTAIAAA